MGLFEKFRKNTSGANEPPLLGTIEKTPSYIMAVPEDDSVLDDLDKLMDKLMALPYIKVISRRQPDDHEFVLEYKGEEFRFIVGVRDFELPELFRIGHDFTEREIGVMETAKRCLWSSMIFGKNNCESFHLQIKLLCALVEDAAGVVDVSGERILSGRWVKLAASSEVPPAPHYLYVIQAVSGEKNDVWLHTHGLNRCGAVELEILASDKENYGSHANIITTMAERIVTKGEFVNEYEPLYIMQLSEDVSIVAAWIDWSKALNKYPAKMLGGMEDRQDGHNENTGVVYLYKNEQDCKERRLSHVSVYNRLLENNPMVMLTSEETDRMRRLARERVGYMIQLFERREEYGVKGILIKVGLEVDEEYRNGDMKEHIWFELKSLDADSRTFTAELTQEPYYVAALKPGDIRRCSFDEITDWAAFTEDTKIDPDSVYRLEQ